MNPVDQALSEFKSEDYTTRIVHAVFRVMPFAPPMAPYTTCDEAVNSLYPSATPQMRARVQELAAGEGAASALKVASAIDAGDSGLAVYSGLKSALGFFFGPSKQDALETDPQQGLDAGLKLLALSYMIYKAFPGSMQEKVQLFHTCPAGQALMLYYGAVEVGLPFTDNLVQEGGGFLDKIMSRFGGEAGSKLGMVLGAEATAHATGMLGQLMGPVQGMVTQVAPYATQIANAAKQYVPGFMTTADKVAGVVATGADTLPVYKFLGARLAAESCVLIASRGGLSTTARGALKKSVDKGAAATMLSLANRR